MINAKRIKEYARLAIVTGVNLQKEQVLVLNASVETKEMVRILVEEAYQAGAKRVIVNYNDEYVSRMHYKYAQEEVLCDIPDYLVSQKVEPLRAGAAVLTLISEIPGILNGLDSQKIAKANMALQDRCQEVNALTMANKVQWCLIGVPNVSWAKKVFPDLCEEEALDALWEAVLKSVHVQEGQDAVQVWKENDAKMAQRVQLLNDYNFATLHFTNNLGTDLYVDLVDNHLWAGGSDKCVNGVVFNANMPTEEVFTMPYKFGVNGTVVSSKPLHFNGNIVPSFSLTFEKGKVVDFHAEEEADTLRSLLAFDEGSKYLGEVALVPHSSPISQSNILFFNTLYDENASCHLALGRAYPVNVKGGTEMSQAQLNEIGSNHSLTHVDFMFGTKDMKIVGILQDGTKVDVFNEGDFVL